VSDVTRILDAIEAGDRHAVGQLLPLVYDELRRLAAAQLARERPGQTLDATALVHEAYLRLVSPVAHAPGSPGFASRGHFLAAAAEAMRRILIDNARRKQAARHGGGRRRVPLDEAHRIAQSPDDLLALDDALARLAAEDAPAAELVKLRVFTGLSVEEAAAALGLARATAYRHWSFARAWLRCELGDDAEPPPA
jgi:RNA polymerase sigma factor (TIGR02999 family)